GIAPQRPFRSPAARVFVPEAPRGLALPCLRDDASGQRESHGLLGRHSPTPLPGRRERVVAERRSRCCDGVVRYSLLTLFLEADVDLLPERLCGSEEAHAGLHYMQGNERCRESR